MQKYPPKLDAHLIKSEYTRIKQLYFDACQCLEDLTTMDPVNILLYKTEILDLLQRVKTDMVELDIAVERTVSKRIFTNTIKTVNLAIDNILCVGVRYIDGGKIN